MSFFELNIGVSGLFASQRGLGVTGNNISNASTTGYSRQVLTQKADTPLMGIGTGMIGTGVTTVSVDRLRNEYLDKKLWYQNARLGEYSIKKTQHSIIETVYGEPSDKGFSNVSDQLFSALTEVSKNPSGEDQKVILRQQAINFCEYYNNITTNLHQYQSDLNGELKSRVEEINNLATRIQNLNGQIFSAEIYGDEASSFRDERDLCIDRLSQIVETEVIEDEKSIGEYKYSTCKVQIAGQTLVDHVYMWGLELEARTTKQNPEDAEGLYDIKWSNGVEFDMKATHYSGELKGIIDMRDGAGTGEAVAYNGIPYYISRMDNYVRTFAKTMNEEYSKNKDGYIEIEPQAINGETAQYMKNEDGVYTYYYKDAAGDYQPIDTTGLEPQVLQDAVKLKDILFSYTGDDGYTAIVPQTITVASSGITYTAEYMKEDIAHPGQYNFYYYDTTTGSYKEITGLTDAEKTTIHNGVIVNNNKKAPVAFPDFSGNYEKMTASNFSVSNKLYTKPNSIKTTFSGDEESGTQFMLNLVKQKDNKQMFKEGDPKDFMVSIFSDLGIGSQESQMYYSTQKSITHNIENERLSVSQVSISDEFTNLIKYQQAYQAAAKFMTTMDDVYNTTIFKLGTF